MSQGFGVIPPPLNHRAGKHHSRLSILFDFVRDQIQDRRGKALAWSPQPPAPLPPAGRCREGRAILLRFALDCLARPVHHLGFAFLDFRARPRVSYPSLAGQVIDQQLFARMKSGSQKKRPPGFSERAFEWVRPFSPSASLLRRRARHL